VFLVDRLLIGGIRFVLENLAQVADHEMNDEGSLREELLAAHARVELGEIPEEDFRELEAALLARMRAIREEREGPAPDGPVRIAGVELETAGEEHAPPAGPSPALPAAREPAKRRPRRSRA
jgi:hypothetical protein